MSILHTTVNPRSAEFLTNRDAMLPQVDALHTLLNQVQQGGGAKAQERHTSRGKLLPREVCRSCALAPPPCCTCASRACKASTCLSMASRLSPNSAERGLIVVCKMDMPALLSGFR